MSFAHTPIVHSGIWTGAQLGGRDEWQHVLSVPEHDELRTLLASASQSQSDAGPDHRSPQDLSRSEIPVVHLLKRLNRIQHELEHGSGVVRVQGLPAEVSEAEGRALFWALSVHLGTPVSQSASGERIFSVRNSGISENDPRSRGPNSSKKLSFHTDRADVTGFLCLRQAVSGGENAVVSSMAIYNEVLRRRPELLPELMHAFYYLRHTVDSGNAEPWCRQPVFSFARGHFACCLLRVLIERAHRESGLPDLTPLQTEALDLVEEIASEPRMHFRFHQKPGELILLNNWVVLHRRTAFQDAPEPELARHILRVWLSMPNSRPLDPVFRDNWGAVEAGVVRGGMRAVGEELGRC